MSIDQEMARVFKSDMLPKFGVEGSILKFKWKTREYRAVMDSNELSEELQSGGFLADAAFDLYCLREDFNTQPKIGELIAIGDPAVSYRILHVSTSEGDPCLKLTCHGKDH